LIYTPEQKLTEIRRELLMRRRVYPHRIEDGRLSAEDAARQIAIMKAIEEDYARLVPAMLTERPRR